MSAFSPVPLPVCDGTPGDPAGVRDGVTAWVGSAPLRALTEEFGGVVGDGGTAETLARLDDFSAAHWDIRDGRERTEARRHAFEPGTAALV
ncbi:MAG TPA: hypothetical protein VGF17_10355, partial [Phytomonospora sp.]